jgi:hypothetical protein
MQICPWCRKKSEIKKVILECKCGSNTEFCPLTGFAIHIQSKTAKTPLIGAHGDHCELRGEQREQIFRDLPYI